MSDSVEDEARAKKRAEIMAKVAAAQAAQREAAEAAPEPAPEPQDPKTKYGLHRGIVCDGCGTDPVMGYRWKCTKCGNHDLCDDCHEIFKSGVVPQGSHADAEPLSDRPQDHDFILFSDSTMKSATGKVLTKDGIKKIKPNEPCYCGSNKKYKKCCMNKYT